ncbi:MAG: 30S ribosomal protein S2, partial [Solirubrobacteraceae bacterium]
MAQVGLKELLEAGVHFGHQTRRWNPKMRRFIHAERDGLYLIDLQKTQTLLADAQEFAGTLAHRGGTVLFVGTKKQARDAIKDVAEASGMPYVNNRWLGGLLTNFQTISQRIKRLHDLERYEAEGQLALLPTRERLSAEADLAKLRLNLGGVKNMKGVPSAMFVVDLKTEMIAVQEAKRLRIPIIGLVDTNCDPDGIEFVVPGNDDAIRSCAVIARAIGDVVAEGSGVYRAEQDRLRAEADERARREAEERARREAEEQAKREVEEQAKREADEQARRDVEEQAKRPSPAAPAATPAPTPRAPQAPPPEAPARLAKAAGQAAAAKAEAEAAASAEVADAKTASDEPAAETSAPAAASPAPSGAAAKAKAKAKAEAEAAAPEAAAAAPEEAAAAAPEE